MRAGSQLKFWKERVEHGGELAVGKRKERRPFAAKKSMHLTMKASRASGRHSMLAKGHAKFIRATLATLAARWNIRVYAFSNNGNHLHLLIKARDKRGFQGFLRAFSGILAMHMTGAAKGRSLVDKFFDHIPFTRIVEWGIGYEHAKAYVFQNYLEALGFILYTPRK